MDLKKVRLEHNWSQDQLAEIAGVSSRTIQRIENGSPPSMDTLKALAAGFGTTVEELRERLEAPDAPDTVFEDSSSMKATIRDWRGFLVNTAIFMAVITWLLILQQEFGFDAEIVGSVALIWGMALAYHLAKTIAKVTQEPKAD